MINLNTYIIEKLKINKNTKINDKKEILVVFYLDNVGHPAYNTFSTVIKAIDEIKKRRSFVGVFDITESTYSFSRILDNIEDLYATESNEQRQNLLDEIDVEDITPMIRQLLDE